MIIRELILKSFGKFTDKTISLQEGLNIIVGDNEAGKSTIHQFIEGMFYGLYKPNTKNKKVSDAYDKYLPWQNPNAFSGVMTLEDEGAVRIERSFLKSQDLVKVFDPVTGEELTDHYPYDSVTRNHLPGQKHLNMSLSTYKNTISIGQMAHLTTEELSLEIKNKMINIGETKSIDVSLTNVLRQLEERRAQIGTLRSKKSTLGKLQEALGQLENEKAQSLKVWETIESLRLKEQTLQEEIAALESRKLDIDRKMATYRYSKEAASVKKANELEHKLRELSQEIESLRPFMRVSKEDIHDTIKKMAQLEYLKKEQSSLKDRITTIQNEVSELEEEMEALEKVAVEEIPTKSHLWVYVTIFLNVILLVVCLLIRSWPWFIAFIISLSAFFLVISRNISRDKKGAKEEAVQKLHAYEQKKNSRLEQLLGERNRFITLTNRINHETSAVSKVLNQLGVTSETDLRVVLEKQENYRVLEVAYQTTSEMLAEMPYSSGEFTPVIEEIDLSQTNESYELLETTLRDLQDTLLLRNRALSALSSEIQGLENTHRNPVRIDEELQGGYQELEQMKFKLSSLHLVEEALMQISSDFQRSFAPALNHKVSEIIGAVTAGKYEEVKIDPNMEITVLDKEAAKYVKVESLSLGTLDLMYFAMRLGISELMSKDKKLPLLLDDSFVQCDRKRLGKLLEILSKLDRQILLFTCHQREEEFLEILGSKIHIIRI